MRDAYRKGTLRLSWERRPYGRERLCFVVDGPMKVGLLRAAVNRYSENDGYVKDIREKVDAGLPFEGFVPQGEEGIELAEDLKALNHPEAAVIVHVWAVEPERQRLEREAEALMERAAEL